MKVAQRPLDSIRELVVPIRRSVETFALRSYFATITEEDFARWSAILEKMRTACLADDFHSIAEQDIAFHRAIVRRAGQKDLDALWSAIVARIRHHFAETQQSGYSQPISIFDEHVRILDVFREGDVDAAVEAWRRTLRKPHAGMRPRILGHHQPSLARSKLRCWRLSPLPRNGGEGTKPKNAQLQNLRAG